MNLKLNAFLILFYCFILNFAKGQSSFYDINTIQKIEIYFSQTNWDYQLDTARYGADGYLLANWVRINGMQFDSVDVKYKGNSSYDSTYSKNPLHIELDGVINQSYQGITDIKLGNGYADPSVVREVLAYDILQNYMDCPQSNFAQLYINGDYIGLYSNDESINKDFCSSHFNSSSNTFIKCNPLVIPGPTTKSNLKHIPLADSSAYFNFYEMKSDYGWNELVTLCDTVTNFPSNIANNLDMDRVMWMLAFNSVLVNLDSYSGVFCQNYYLYKDKTGRFNPIVWDLNMAFGGFPFAGSGNTSMGSLTVTNMQQFPPDFHSNDVYWPVIKAVMNDATYKKMYIAHARTINNENFVNNSYQVKATYLQSIIDSAVQSDLNSFFSYSQFQNGLTTDYTVGSYTVPGISNLMTARVSYLQTNTDFSYVPPVITLVTASDSTPLFNSSVDLTANVTNANAVYLGYRNKKSDRFERIPMYDDGAHNDGAAGDQVYGISIFAVSPQIQYYIFAENATAGMFSPERAEHEFYSLQTEFNIPSAGQVVINELLAGNVTDTINEYGNHNDWIELYNNTGSPIDLFGLYLTDDLNNLNKFSIPQNTTIQPNDFLIIWADEENTSANYIHANFKLSLNGEGLWLSDGTSVILDSITFGPQVNDVSLQRCLNGTGPFVAFSPTSFNQINCPVSVEEINAGEQIQVYPNPFTDKVSVIYNSNRSNSARLFVQNTMGETIYQSLSGFKNPSGLHDIELNGSPAGIYFLHLPFEDAYVVKKIVKQ